MNMKWTKMRIILVIMQFLCFFAVPIYLIWSQYAEVSTVSQSYKITVTGLIAIAFIFLLAKKIWLNDKITKLQTKQAMIETQSLTATEERAIAKLKTAYKINGVLSMAINAIVPICLMALSILTCKALETQVIKLYGVLCLCSISFGVGYVCKLLEILTVMLPLEQKGGKLND